MPQTKSLDATPARFDNAGMPPSNRLAVTAIAPIIVGIGALVHLISQHRLDTVRTVDVLQLTGAGACFGVALVLLIFALRLKRAS